MLNPIFFYINFFLLKSFDSLFFFMFFKNFNINYLFKKVSINFVNNYKKNNLKIKLNLTLIFYKIVCNKLILSKNYVNFNFLNNISFSYSNFIALDYIFYKYFKFFNNFILDFFNKGQNLLILDSFEKNHFFLYSNMFNLKDVLNYKSFFFPKPDYFCKKNWIFFFNFFCKFNKINLFFINDFFKFSRYIGEISLLNIPFTAIIPAYASNSIIDYPIYYTNTQLKLIQFISVFFLNNLFFINLNYKHLNYKYLFYKNIFYFFYFKK